LGLLLGVSSRVEVGAIEHTQVVRWHLLVQQPGKLQGGVQHRAEDRDFPDDEEKRNRCTTVVWRLLAIVLLIDAGSDSFDGGQN
jgi:hypothetical protein